MASEMSAPKKLVVDVISDVACPWCWVGKRAIETAVANINAARPNSVDLELRWHPFQLSPDIPQGTTVSLMDKLTRIVGSKEVVQNWVTNPDAIPMNQSCKDSKLANIRFSISADAKGFNTYRAHTLLTYAGKKLGDYEKQNKLKEAMLRMTHGEGKNLDSDIELLAAAKEAGIASTADEISAILADAAVMKTLDEELKQARVAPAFNGVPYFTFPNGHHFSGGQPVQVFEKIVKQCL